MSKSQSVKTAEEIEIIAEGGKLLAGVLQMVVKKAVAGVSTKDLDLLAEKEIRKLGGRPSFLGYGSKRNPFSGTLCVSINDEVVHGVPSQRRILHEGDIVGLDIGMEYKKLYTDMAITIGVGKISQLAKKLLEVTKKSLDNAIKQARVGNFMGDIGHAAQVEAEKNGFSMVRDLVGHGVGYAVHEEPEVPHYGRQGTGIKLVENMVIAIEPMVCEKDFHVGMDDDGWTIRTLDGGLSAHFEHTIAITKKGPRILTQ